MSSATLNHNFQGELSALGLLELLGLIQAGRKSGVLALHFPDARLDTRLLFRSGRAGRIQSPLAPRLSEVLLRLGVQRDTLEQGEGDTWTERLNRSVPAPLLARAVRERLESGLLPLLGLERGTFAFSGEPEAGFLEPGVELTSLMLELARRSDELGARLGSDAVGLSPLAQFRSASDPRAFERRSASLSPEAAALLGELGVGRSLHELVQRGWAWDRLAPLTLELERLGLLESAESEPALEGGRLLEGRPAPFFVLPALGGGELALGQLRGKRTMLSFFRHAGCPFCNLRVHRLTQDASRLEAAGLTVVGVFGSPLEHLRDHVGRLEPAFALLADPDDAVHDLYGCERSVWHSLRMHFTRDYRDGVRLGTASLGTANGELTRLPAEFLIGPDLRIERVYYARHASDHLPLEQALDWAQGRSAARGGLR